VRVLYIGDSLTGGYYASDYAHSFPALVTAALHAIDLHPSIYYGHTAANTIAAMNQGPPPAVDLAVIELGINDNDDGNLTLFRQNYADVLERLKRANPAVLLVCLGIWQEATAQPFNDAVRELCQAAGGRYHDLAPLYSVEAYHGPLGRPTWVGPGDWFHPNDAGHAAIAAAVLQTLGVQQ
jgi:lysophospholipase L1-like esterase